MIDDEKGASGCGTEIGRGKSRAQKKSSARVSRQSRYGRNNGSLSPSVFP